jgi:hypothetical protein
MTFASDVAWVVSSEGADDGVEVSIVYAPRAYVARQRRAAELGGDVKAVTATRARWADEYAGRAIPPSAWLDAGYSHTCGQCTEVVDPDPGGVATDEHGVYCSSSCRRGAKAYRRWRDRAMRQAAKRLAVRIPGARVQYASVGTLGECAGKHGHDGYVVFRFPGGTDTASYCGACRVAYVAPGDVVAFRAQLAGASRGGGGR